MKTTCPRRFIIASSVIFLTAASVGISGATDYSFDGNLSVANGFLSGTSSATGGVELRSGGLMLSKGLYTGTSTLTTADQGAGTRMLWYPGKAAFRAGKVSGTHWNDANIGLYSTAFGNNSTAKNYSFASGSFATATGEGSVAMGEWVSALSASSTAMGFSSVASGYAATAIGDQPIASGERSLALGYLSSATGDCSAAIGEGTISASFGSMAIGRYNVGGGDLHNWVTTDPLFEIGNGSPGYFIEDGPWVPPALSNAVTVYKNGNMDVQGAITCAPGGDIPMFGGN